MVDDFDDSASESSVGTDSSESSEASMVSASSGSLDGSSDGDYEQASSAYSGRFGSKTPASAGSSAEGPSQQSADKPKSSIRRNVLETPSSRESKATSSSPYSDAFAAEAPRRRRAKSSAAVPPMAGLGDDMSSPT
eukprot:7388475-Prymnesium_polylepis.1